MKIIEQYYQSIKEKDQLKLIELAGRTCYKSEDKITEDSAKQFVKMLTKSGHHAMLEFGHACFALPAANTDYIKTSDYSKYLIASYHLATGLVSGNFRAWLELFKNEQVQYMPTGVLAIGQFLYKKYPEIFPNLGKTSWVRKAEPVHEIDMTPEQKKVHAVRTVRLITNRGVTHELVRHRPCSFAQESTRYVKYDNDMEFIKPVWYEANDDKPNKIFRYACEKAEFGYIGLRTNGWRPEQAREVLPNSLKTEIVVKATLEEWFHIFKLRCTKAAHPQIRALLTPLLAELKEQIPAVFNEI